MKNHSFKIGVILVILAALGNSLGQLFWKLGADAPKVSTAIIWYLLGFLFAGIGMVLLMLSFRFGEVSILQPMMSISYIFSMIFGMYFLGEGLTGPKVAGTILIVIAAALLGSDNEEEKVGNQ